MNRESLSRSRRDEKSEFICWGQRAAFTLRLTVSLSRRWRRFGAFVVLRRNRCNMQRMSDSVRKVKCKDCGFYLNMPSNAERPPCPACGSTTHAFILEAGAAAYHFVQGKARLKHKDVNHKLIREVITGPDLCRKDGKWKQLHRSLDHKADLYREIVTDPESGGIVHQCEEPLSEHRGHGDDKKNRRKN